MKKKLMALLAVLLMFAMAVPALAEDYDDAIEEYEPDPEPAYEPEPEPEPEPESEPEPEPEPEPVVTDAPTEAPVVTPAPVEPEDDDPTPSHMIMYVAKVDLEVYKKQSTNSSVVATLPYGLELVIEAIGDNGWYGTTYVSKGKSKIGWVQSKYLSATPLDPANTPKPTKKPKDTAKPTATPSPAEREKKIDGVLSTMVSVVPYQAEIRTKASDGRVAMRWQPTTNGKLIGYLNNGARVIVLAEGDGWNQVRDESTGYTGFISNDYLTRVSVAVREKTVMPVSDELNLSALEDGVYPVSFDRGDMLLGASGIFMNNVYIYTIERYSLEDMLSLNNGDIIYIGGVAVNVSKVIRNGNIVVLNGGMDYADGYILYRPEGAMWYCMYTSDGTVNFNNIGVTTLTVDASAVYTDVVTAEGGIITATGAEMIDAMREAENDVFNCFNTTVTIKDGVVTEINRVYTRK